MNFRKMITLIEMLALTGVMSVGFSTWVIVETSFPEIQIQVETENVFNTNEYLEIKNLSCTRSLNTCGPKASFLDVQSGPKKFASDTEITCIFMTTNITSQE